MMSKLLSLTMKMQGKPVLRGIDHYWSVIMERHRAGEAFTARDVDMAGNANKASARDYIRRLERAGLIERVDETSGGAGIFRPLVIQSTAPRVRRDGSVIESLPANQCMWNMMRGPNGRSGFTWRDLVAWSQTDETAIKPMTAKSYIKTLHAAGYLIAVKPGTARKPAIWRLLPNMTTGPEAPKILRTKMVYDPNKNAVINPVNADEVQP